MSDAVSGDGAIIDLPGLERMVLIAGSAYVLGLNEKTQAICEGIVTFCPGRRGVGPLIGLALAAYSSGRPSEAIELLRDRALPMEPDSVYVLSNLAMVLRSEGRIDEARPYLEATSGLTSDEETRQFIQNVKEGCFDPDGN